MPTFPFKTLLSFTQKRFLTTPATLSTSTIPPSSSFTVEYLMKLCGPPLESALSSSQNIQLDEKKHESVLNFLKSRGFADTQIGKLILKSPRILQCKLDKNLVPKIDYLIKIGFEGPLLADLIVRNPCILTRSLNSHLKPSFDFLKTYLGTDEKVVAAIKRSSCILTSNLKGIMQSNIDFLIKEGVPARSISKLVTLQPRVIVLSVDKVVCSVNTIKKLGIKASAPMFVHCLRVISSMSESTWNKKVEVFKSLGWSEEDVISTFKRDPFCLACSEDKLRRVMDFYVNTLKFESDTIIAYPKVLKYAVDKRLRPRYNVIKALESKNLLKEKSIAWVLTLSEKTFFERYVRKHVDKIPELMELYGATNSAKKIDI